MSVQAAHLSCLIDVKIVVWKVKVEKKNMKITHKQQRVKETKQCF